MVGKCELSVHMRCDVGRLCAGVLYAWISIPGLVQMVVGYGVSVRMWRADLQRITSPNKGIGTLSTIMKATILILSKFAV